MRLNIPAKSLASLGAAALALASLASAARGESVAALAEKGNALYKQERLQDAIDLYRDAIAREPESPLIQYNLGTALSRDQKYDEAAKILQQAAQTPSQYSGDASFNLGVTRAESILKNHPQVQQFLKASPSTETPIPPQTAAAVDPKGVKESVDELQDALGSFRQSVVKTPGSSEAKYNYEVTRQMIDRLKQLQQVQQQQQQTQNQDNKKQDQQQQSQDQKQQQQNKDQQNKDQQSQNQQGQKQNQDKDQQKQDDKSDPKQQDKGQDGKGEPQATPTPAPQPTAPPKDGEPKSGDKGDSGQKPQPTPPPSQDSAGDGSDAKPQMNPDQMDAMRLLQLLESDKPEQFKKLFQFQGKLRQNQSGKDW